MTNKEIANKFNLLGRIMELHGENPFKIRSYANAYLTIRKWPTNLIDLTEEELASIKGIGKAISSKIRELADTGEMQTLNRYLDKTPEGIVEMLGIKGFGPKKIKVVWQELGVESIGELMYAVNENRLLDLKGFGQKTQDALRIQLEYFLESRDSVLFAAIEDDAEKLMEELHASFPDELSAITGDIRRKCQTIDKIELVTTIQPRALENGMIRTEGGQTYYDIHPLVIHEANKANFGTVLFRTTGSESFLSAYPNPEKNFADEEGIFNALGIPFVIPEMRERETLDRIKAGSPGSVITQNDLRGAIHTHTTYSDGMNSLEQMVAAAKIRGWSYIVITDHSRAAFYANGLDEERLLHQVEEIRELNSESGNFRVFSGIESDILNDGRLDYPDAVLNCLDVIIASVHSNLKMDEDKATNRILTAIKNPFTSILGHPTGRLLLSRKGYPLNHRAVIEACADHNVAIEINANPYRLDLDWKWIGYALEKNVLLSINPDAHSVAGMDHMVYGVYVARKAGLPRESCLNTFDLDKFSEWLTSQHAKRPEV